MKCGILFGGILLCSTLAFSQEKFGIVVCCNEQVDFARRAKCGNTFGVTGLGVLHAGIVDFSLGLGYSYKYCTYDEAQITGIGHTEIFQTVHKMHFLNIPFAVSVQCWQQGDFQLKVHNKLKYNKLCKHLEFPKDDRQTKSMEKWGDIPREARNGLTYLLGLTASYCITEHCILNLSPFFGVKAILNQFEPYPTHFPSEQHHYLPDHRFSCEVIIGMEYRF